MTNTRDHLSNIRDFLMSGFSDTELREICFDTPALRPVYDQLGASSGKTEIVSKLIEYAERRLQLDLLLSLAEDRNPARYQQHQPYRLDVPPSPQPSRSLQPTETTEASTRYSCFISYSSQDEAFAQRLHVDLQQEGVRCWFAPENMRIGDKVRATIDQSIKSHRKLLLILSEHSIDSAWVEKEVETAFEEEQQRGEVILFPIRLDETVMGTGQPWAADIRRMRHIGNFTQWQDEAAYQGAFKRLVRDLKAE